MWLPRRVRAKRSRPTLRRYSTVQNCAFSLDCGICGVPSYFHSTDVLFSHDMPTGGQVNQRHGAQRVSRKGSKKPLGSDALVLLARMLARLAAAEAIREHRAEVDEARFPF